MIMMDTAPSIKFEFEHPAREVDMRTKIVSSHLRILLVGSLVIASAAWSDVADSDRIATPCLHNIARMESLWSTRPKPIE